MGLQALSAAVLLSLVFTSDLCHGATHPRVVIFSDSDALLREQALGGREGAGISPRGLAAASAALLGLPTPPTTNAAVAQEVNSLLVPSPFYHASHMLVLTVKSAPAIPDDWLTGAAFSTAEGQHQDQAQARRVGQQQLSLLGVDGEPLEALEAELKAVQDSTHGLNFFPSSWLPLEELEPKDAWDSVLLNGAALGGSARHSSAALTDTLGEGVTAYIEHVMKVAKWVEAGAASSDGPVLGAASISLAALSGHGVEAKMKALEGAVAALLASTLKARGAGGPSVVALVLDEGGYSNEEPAILLPSPGQSGSRGRALLEADGLPPETPEDVINRAVYLVVVLFLLTAFAIGMCLMCGMPVTRDTLLYSGAKVD